MDVKIGENIRSDDFKTEKHVPVIEALDAVKKVRNSMWKFLWVKKYHIPTRWNII